ncbi:hypothetical protein [Phenylobacterium sp.]|uniref:hypothetical protein n=1 Tax=Phenylobacterium sp. TaxID=1871053 RepID=UPI0025D7B887|nr:hypothetical protein [Phenylobacterium sp.]
MRPIPALALAGALLAPGVAALAATPGPPSTPSMDVHGVPAAFGNTIKAQYPDGHYQRLWFKPDGTWEAVGRRGYWSSGKWSQKDGDKLCLKQAKPFPAPFKYCTVFPAGGGIGAVWTSKDMAGEPIRVTLIRGIERPANGAGS